MSETEAIDTMTLFSFQPQLKQKVKIYDKFFDSLVCSLELMKFIKSYSIL